MYNEKDMINHCVSAIDDNYVHTHVINVDQVTSAVHKLKSDKSDCIDDLSFYNFNKMHARRCAYFFFSVLTKRICMHKTKFL